MPPLHIQDLNHDLNETHIKFHFHFRFPMRKSWNVFMSIACNSRIVSNRITQQQSREKTSRKPMSGPRASSI